MSVAEAKVPTVVAVGLICLALGAGAGIGGMYLYGYQVKDPVQKKEGGAAKGPPAGMVPGGGGGMPKGMGGPGGGAPGGGGPNSKNQLAALVVKLDQLTHKPLAVKLDEGQRKVVHEQLHGLADLEELTDEEAKKRLEALLDLLKDQRDSLEAAGYRWPGGGGGGPAGGRPKDMPNPFKEGANAEHLKSLLGEPAAKG